MSEPSKRRLFPLLLAAALLSLTAGLAAWALWPEEPDEPEVPTEETGMSEERTIRLMEEIGYIQQED